MKKHLLKFLLAFFVSLFLSVGWVNGQVIISQYIETGSGTTPKGIEVWNVSGATIDFSVTNLEVWKGTNGAATSLDFTVDAGTLANGDVIVIGTEPDVTGTGTAFKDFVEANGSVFYTKAFSFNGDDALELYLDGVKTDVFGDPGTGDPGTGWAGNGVQTYNQNISLKSGITTGDTDGWTDPSTRFEVTTSDNSLTGFGIAPISGDTPPIATFLPANGASDVLIGSNITITFDEKIYTSGGVTEIVDGDLATLITLKVGDAGGADVPFSATYSNADPFVITIDPTSDLTLDQDYYVAFGSVFDDANQENAGENAIFHTELGYIPIVSAYSISDDEIEVTYESSMTVVNAGDYNLTGTAAITFTSATIDGTDDKIVHLSGASVTIDGDATLDNIADANSGVDLYAGITPIKYTNVTNPTGTISTGIIATFHGIVSANDAFNGVWVADAEGAYNGILIYNSSFYALVAVGDEIIFTATLSPFSNLSELVSPNLIGSVTPGQTPYGPSVITGATIDQTTAPDTDPAESWEGQLIKIVNAEVTVDIDGNYAYTATDDAGTTTFKIGDNVSYKLTAIPLTVGDFITITGVVDYEDVTYRINPRNVSDIVSATDTVGSTVYTVDQLGLAITGIPYSTTLAVFKSNIAAADSATFDVFDSDGTNPATVLDDTKLLIVTAADGITETTYTITRNAVLTDATVTSGTYTVVEGTPGTISNVPNGTDLATFKSNITAPQYGSFEVYVSDGGAIATDLADGYFLTGTAEDGVTTEDYNIEVSSVVPDTDSEVIAPTTQIAAATIAVVDGDETTEAFDVFSFDINDAGTADGLPTNVSQIVLFFGPDMTLDLNTDDLAGGWFEIDGVAVEFAGEPIVGTDSIAFQFAEGEITVPDGGSVNAITKVYLNANPSDGKVIQFMIDASQHGFETTGVSSVFPATLTGGDIVGNDITIDVVATELNFSVEPTNVFVDAMITPAVVVEAVDANGNIDTDYVTDITITATGATLVGTPVAGTPVAGVATFDAISFSDEGAGVTLTASSGALTDGTSAAFNVTVEPDKDLFFSEYIEGETNSNNRAIEIYNPTNASIDLSAYTVKQSHNGTGWGVDGIAYVLPLTGTITANDVYVIANVGADQNILDEADITFAYSDAQGAKIPFFTGDDALGLFKDDVLIDVIGHELVGTDNITKGPWDVEDTTDATLNHTLLRKFNVSIGNTDWAASASAGDAASSEWIVFEHDYQSNIGSPSYDPSDANIVSFDFQNAILAEDATIDADAATVSLLAINGADLTNQTAVIELSTGASTSDSYTDFSSPVTYTVTAEDGTEKVWTVTATVSTILNDEADILTFTIPNMIDVGIDYTDTTITVNMPYGTNAAALTPAFTLSAGATVDVASGTEQDFSAPFTYTVTAQNTTDIKEWEVTVAVEVITELSIHDIQYTTDASGDSPYNGELVKTSGIVTATNTSGFFIQDGDGAWNGIYVYNNTVTRAVGDEVEFVSEVYEYNNLTELKNVVDFTVLSQDNTLPTVAEITTVEGKDEEYESVLVYLDDVLCTDPDKGNGMFEINDGTGALLVDDVLFAYAADSLAGYDLTGIGYYSYSEWKVIPRSADDVVLVSPVIGSPTMNPVTPTSTEAVTITVSITDNDNDASELTNELFYGSAEGSEDTDVTFEETATANEFEGTIPASASTVYYLITASDGTFDSEYTGSYSVITGIDNPDGIVSMNIFPNPSNGLFNLEMNASKAGNFNVEIINIQGQVVYSKQINQDGFYKDQIDISKEAKGIYYIRINDGMNMQVSKIMIQ